MSLSLIQSTLNTAGPHVGDLLWWSLEDARIGRSLLETIWRDAGLRMDLLPEPPTPEKALRCAVRQAQVGRPNHLIRLGKQDDNVLVFGVVLEQRDDDGNLRHTQETRVTLNRFSPSALAFDNPTHEVAVVVDHEYQLLRNTHTPDDVRRAIIKTLDSCAAVTLREHGGVYWVPAPYASTLRSLQLAISRIGTSRIDVVPVHATPEGQASLGNAARESIQDDISRLKTEIDNFLASPPERLSTLTSRIEAFSNLRAKAQLYHSILQVEVTDLESQLNALTVNCENLIAAKAA